MVDYVTFPGKDAKVMSLDAATHWPARSGASDRGRLRSRWGAVDAARGAAMAFVCLSHFSYTYFPEEDSRGIWLQMIGRIATPTFMILSGIVVSYRMGGAAAKLPRNQRWLVDRGLFLILVGHPLIYLALLGDRVPHLREVFVTDVIGLCLVVAPLFLHLRPLWCLAAGVAILALSWAMVPWNPEGSWLLALKELLVGAMVLQKFQYVFPVLPWFGVFLVATAFGQRVAEIRRSGDAAVARFTFRMAVAALGVAVLGRAAAFLGRLPVKNPWLTWLASLEKLPPSPVYLAFFAGVGLSMLATFIELERRNQLPTLRGVAALVGRNSLAAFVAQYYVYYMAMVLLRPPVSDAWPIWFLGSLAPVLAVAMLWARFGGNRFFTVGLRAPIDGR